MGDIDALIRELEDAPEGSRELDGEIALYLGWAKHHAGWAHWTTPEGLENQHVPFFSDSVDDALTLVPEGWFGGLRFGGFNEAWLRQNNQTPSMPNIVATTPSLALCIAALKARRGG